MNALRKFEITVDAVFEPVRPICRDWAEEVMEWLEDSESCYSTRVDEVENKSRDGFFPYTDGGIDGIGYGDLGHDHSSGSAPAVIQPYIDSTLKSAEEDWDEANPAHPVSWIYAKDDDAQGELLTPSSEREHWREKWWEFQDQYFREGGTYFYKARVLYFSPRNSRNESGEPELFFMVGINTDFEYGRDNIPWLRCYGAKTQQSEWIWEATIKCADLTPELGQQFAKAAIEQLRAA